VSGIHYLKSWLLKKPIQLPRSTDMSLYATGIIRIISDPALRSFDSGSAVLNFVGGILEGKDKNGEYIENVMDIEVWDKNSANAIQKYCKLKDCIFVSGVVKMQTWKDKDTGKSRRKHVLSVHRFEFLPRTTPTEEPAF
jgi:single-strand DNA-binding protein